VNNQPNTPNQDPHLHREWNPLSPEEHHAQLNAILDALAPHRPAAVLDLGAGNGRIARPLAEAGHTVTATDTHPAALAELTSLQAQTPNLIPSDANLTQPLPTPIQSTRFDAVLCLGHTFMIITDPLDALALLQRIRPLLKPHASFIIDDILTDTWRDIADGNWAAGPAEPNNEDTNPKHNEPVQLVFAERDPIIAFRYGDDIDPSRTNPDQHDQTLRLYSLGELRLLAHAAGFNEPAVQHEHNTITITPAPNQPATTPNSHNSP